MLFGNCTQQMACQSVNPYGLLQEVTRVSCDNGPEILWVGAAVTMRDICHDLIPPPIPTPFLSFSNWSLC